LYLQVEERGREVVHGVVEVFVEEKMGKLLG
jgi:hypothetical protein